MARQILKLPSVPNGTAKSNIAGILPLSSLIELVDVETKLHCYELSGRGITWNWPITPVGARIILEQCGSEQGRRPSVCFLDAEEGTEALQCTDMRFADMYVSANRFTMRTCIQLTPLLPPFPHVTPDPYRPYRTYIVTPCC
jgi:hypothetical protein